MFIEFSGMTSFLGMVKKALAGKSGKYGKNLQKGGLKNKTAGKVKKTKFKSKKTAPQSGKKALVSKEVLEALKENRKDKQNKRQEQLDEKKKNPSKKRKTPETKEPREPLKKKALKKVRKANEDNEYENITKIKALWEKGRVNDIAPSKRTEIVAELKELMEGKVESLMFKHDLARVVQLLLRLGKAEDSNFIVKELLPHVCELSKAKYGKFTVNCMLKNTSREQTCSSEVFLHFRELIKTFRRVNFSTTSPQKKCLPLRQLFFS